MDDQQRIRTDPQTMPNITDTREAFFARHGVEPCRHCMAREIPGTGIGRIYGEMLLELYMTGEAERLQRLLDAAAARQTQPLSPSQRIQPDAWDETLRKRNHALYIRACWLLDTCPEQTADPSVQVQQMLAATRAIAHPKPANADTDEADAASQTRQDEAA